MTTTVYWGTNIPGPWYKFAAGILLCGRLFSGTAAFAAESPANARLTTISILFGSKSTISPFRFLIFWVSAIS